MIGLQKRQWYAWLNLLTYVTFHFGIHSTNRTFIVTGCVCILGCSILILHELLCSSRKVECGVCSVRHCSVSSKSCDVPKRNASVSWRLKTTNSRWRSSSYVPRWKQFYASCSQSWTANLVSNWRSPPTASCSREKRRGGRYVHRLYTDIELTAQTVAIDHTLNCLKLNSCSFTSSRRSDLIIITVMCLDYLMFIAVFELNNLEQPFIEKMRQTHIKLFNIQIQGSSNKWVSM